VESEKVVTSGTLVVRTRHDHDVRRLALAGELDLDSAATLESELTAVLEGAPGRLLVDMSELQFIDSSGMRTLFLGIRRATEGGWTVTVVPGQDVVMRALEVAGLLDEFPFGQAPGE